ncbi:MAG: hypothetical protein IJX22_04110 [Opitutales bacterium]|nr:hypothetical protein [Opitutales bacterium]
MFETDSLHQIDGLMIERRKIEIGVGNLNFIEIKSGLNEGDDVATTRPSQSEIVGGDSGAPAKKKGDRPERRGGNGGPPPPM